ncbi:MAG: asparagine synthase (glutamine-hydrolyzing) [Defluviitaleaceae bacterium]|nr:asparagine synthase (glutamine-hydrolyzing) [Defluviitaleaceae bacterium]
MCGFAGFTVGAHGSRSVDEHKEIIVKMTEKIAHRGPDGDGIFIDRGVVFGFRRLAFLDLEHGEQPMRTGCGRYTIVFNGEIYNYKALRDELIEQGYNFNTNSDTEVILNLYAQHGQACLNMLRGMFAFVIYDAQTGGIFAARDYFGIKPFYYGMFGGQMLFASEIKALLEHPDFERAINPAALSAYLSFQYSVLDESMFKGVYKLPPAHFMRFCGGEVQIERYWQAEFTPDKGVNVNLPNVVDEIVNRIDDVVGDSVQAHLVSDVPIGSFLSSGVDSSWLAARFGGDATFTVGFDYEGYNEIEYAEELSKDLGIVNHSKLITTQEYWDNLGNIQYHMDEPLADPAAVALYFVSQVAAQHVKGVLSGEGADELFGGYNIYQEPLALRTITWLPRFVRRGIGAVARKLPNFWGRNFLIRGSQSVEERYIGGAKIFSEKERDEILRDKSHSVPTKSITAPFYDKTKGYDDITKMQFIDLHMWLVGDILLKADKMTMAHSIEGRVPYMDKEVFKVAAALPVSLRVTKQTTKHAFRKAAAKHLKPKWSEKKKLGFPVPIRLWLKEDFYYAKVKAAFTSDASREFFNTDALLKILDKHKLGKADNSRKIWTVYTFLLWHEQFFN